MGLLVDMDDAALRTIMVHTLAWLDKTSKVALKTKKHNYIEIYFKPKGVKQVKEPLNLSEKQQQNNNNQSIST
jgi:hypothetical protein